MDYNLVNKTLGKLRTLYRLGAIFSNNLGKYYKIVHLI